MKNGYVYTNEGNTSALYGDSNGGTVKTKKYRIGDSSIQGYCLVDYEKDEGIVSKPGQSESQIQTYPRVKEYQKWMNRWYGRLMEKHCGSILELDRQYGSNTRKASMIVWKDVVNRLYSGKLKLEGEEFDRICVNTARRTVLSLGSAGTLTAIAEGILAAAGFYTGDIDAQFGEKLAESTKEFQKKYKLEVDGQIGNETWAALFDIMYDRTD